MEPDAMIFVFWMLSFKPTFSLSSFTFIKRILSSSSLSAIRGLFIIGDWNAKVGSQEIAGVTGKLGFGIQNEAGQRLAEFCKENALVIANTLFQQHKRRLYTWTSPDGQHRNQIDYILCQQKQDQELTVSRIMNALLPNSDWNWRKWRKPLDHSGMT